MADDVFRAGNYSVVQVTRRIPKALAGLRLDQALARMFPEHSRSRLQAWLREGNVRLDARAAKPKQKIWGGECVEIQRRPGPADLAHGAEPIPLEIVHEDEAVLVINKPAGLVVHPGSGNWRGTLLNALLHRSPQLAGIPRAGIVHRLDKDTSGLLVVAKTLQAQTDLVRQLQARTVKREYLAVVHGVVKAGGEIAAPLGRDPRSRTRMAVVSGGKPALTRYRVLKRFASATLLECSLATGRTHQIRVHMQSLGHPLLGEPVYRDKRLRKAQGAEARRQALHAAGLEFSHPVSGARTRFEAPLPEDLRALLDALG
ncbi:MAG TPA: 23S rRNA pseudouridine(1911/1915/1917) synthase RluD [Burkholderiales bacterium]|nr:23S rRNA pseudouridine(1911/1915/1917) synthase RluD [Burkholderiales bacterium]